MIGRWVPGPRIGRRVNCNTVKGNHEISTRFLLSIARCSAILDPVIKQGSNTGCMGKDVPFDIKRKKKL